MTAQSDADPLRAWQSVFYFDTVTTAVVSSDPAEGATLLRGRRRLCSISMSQSIRRRSAWKTCSLTTASSLPPRRNRATAVRYDVGDLIEDGTVNYELKADAILDVHGNPARPHVGGFNVDDPLDQPLSIEQRSAPDRRFGDGNVGPHDPHGVTIADIDVSLDISHTYDADLDVTLIAPNGTRVELFSDVGGGGANFVGTVLDDEASTAIQTGAAPFTGRFRPEGPLSVLDGLDTVGTWTLEIRDDAGHRRWHSSCLGVDHSPGGRSSATNSRRGAVARRSWQNVARHRSAYRVQFSEAMQPATVNAANWELREAGADEAFDTPDDVLYSLATSPVYAAA